MKTSRRTSEHRCLKSSPNSLSTSNKTRKPVKVVSLEPSTHRALPPPFRPSPPPIEPLSLHPPIEPRRSLGDKLNALARHSVAEVQKVELLVDYFLASHECICNPTV